MSSEGEAFALKQSLWSCKRSNAHLGTKSRKCQKSPLTWSPEEAAQSLSCTPFILRGMDRNSSDALLTVSPSTWNLPKRRACQFISCIRIVSTTKRRGGVGVSIRVSLISPKMFKHCRLETRRNARQIWGWWMLAGVASVFGQKEKCANVMRARHQVFYTLNVSHVVPGYNIGAKRIQFWKHWPTVRHKCPVAAKMRGQRIIFFLSQCNIQQQPRAAVGGW